MGFPSIPAYLDPSNWHQQQNHQIIGSTSTNPLLPPPPHPGLHPPPPLPQPHGAGGPGSIRPGSMAERARMTNTMPETILKCPRCDSSNTKFCYYNNYNLSQPRHFCKSCRRYWTKGGAMRNVPVGGGCRRNKRSKSTTSSKSPANRTDGQTISGSTSSMSTNSGATILGLTPPLRFMSPLSQLSENFGNELVLNNFGGVSAPMVGTSEMNNFHNNLFGGGGIDTWRLQQSFPFLGGLDNSNLNGIYQFHQGGNGFMGGGAEGSNPLHVRPKFSSSILSQLTAPPVKMEENGVEMNHSRRLLGGGVAATGNNNNDHQWNINSGGGVPNWMSDLSSFSSSSTSNAL